MKTFAHVPGVTYPDPSAPEAHVEPRQPTALKPLRVYVPRHVARHTLKIDGRNISTIWMRQNGLCIRTIDGVRTVVPR